MRFRRCYRDSRKERAREWFPSRRLSLLVIASLRISSLFSETRHSVSFLADGRTFFSRDETTAHVGRSISCERSKVFRKSGVSIVAPAFVLSPFRGAIPSSFPRIFPGLQIYRSLIFTDSLAKIKNRLRTKVHETRTLKK